jgi:hypothetical protein
MLRVLLELDKAAFLGSKDFLSSFETLQQSSAE